jgi:hypothetical protein
LSPHFSTPSYPASLLIMLDAAMPALKLELDEKNNRLE